MIRNVDATDLERVRTLLASVPEAASWSADEFRIALQGDLSARVAEEEGIACGLVVFRTMADEAEILNLAVASTSRRRLPTATTPISFRSSAVSFGRTSQPIAFSTNAGAYCSSPSPRSHSPMSIAAPDRSKRNGYPWFKRISPLGPELQHRPSAFWRRRLQTCWPTHRST